MNELENAVIKAMDSIFDLQHLAPLPIELFSALQKAEYELAVYLKELTE